MVQPKRSTGDSARSGTAAASRHNKRLSLLVDQLNKYMKEGGKVALGREIDYLTYERMPSGSLGLDLIMGGGLPRRAIVQYKGQESSGKSFMALQACSLAQARGEHVAWFASEGFDLPWARKCGVYIPYSQKELKLRVERGQFGSLAEAEKLSAAYDAEHDGWGSFFLGQSYSSGPMLLEAMSRAVRSGACSLVVLDSAGAILTEEDDDKDVGDSTRVGGNAKLLGHFIAKLRKSLGGKVEGEDYPNETCVLIINQVRAQIGVFSRQGAPPPEAGGGFALKHGKDVDIRFSRGESLQLTRRKKILAYGQHVRAKCEKNKTASPMRTAQWTIFFRDVPEESAIAGTVDIVQEVLEQCLYYGLIELRGSFMTIDDQKLQGTESATQYLRQHPETLQRYHEAVLDMQARGTD
jgi:recombination protein RecA